jgi:hypothetical protein
MKRKTSKEFQNDMAMACIVLCARKIFSFSPSISIFYQREQQQKISGMAVAL